MGRIKEKTEYTEELIQDRLHTHFMSMSNTKHVMENLFVLTLIFLWYFWPLTYVAITNMPEG